MPKVSPQHDLAHLASAAVPHSDSTSDEKTKDSLHLLTAEARKRARACVRPVVLAWEEQNFEKDLVSADCLTLIETLTAAATLLVLACVVEARQTTIRDFIEHLGDREAAYMDAMNNPPLPPSDVPASEHAPLTPPPA